MSLLNPDIVCVILSEVMMARYFRVSTVSYVSTLHPRNLVLALLMIFKIFGMICLMMFAVPLESLCNSISTYIYLSGFFSVVLISA